MKCKKCGYLLTTEDIFCPRCGTKKDISNGKHENILFAFYKANKWPMSILGVVIVVAICIMAHSISEKRQENELWREYMMSQNDNIYQGGIDFNNLHKYANSTYKIGDTMPAGEYVLFASGNTSGYFCLSSDSSGNSIIANENFDYTSIITVYDGEYLKLSRCYAEPIGSAGTLSTTGEGMFKIGTHLSAGEYKLEATSDSGYYCVYSDGRQDDIYNNDNFSGTTYVTVREGQYLVLNRCKIVY